MEDSSLDERTIVIRRKDDKWQVEYVDHRGVWHKFGDPKIKFVDAMDIYRIAQNRLMQ